MIAKLESEEIIWHDSDENAKVAYPFEQRISFKLKYRRWITRIFTIHCNFSGHFTDVCPIFVALDCSLLPQCLRHQQFCVGGDIWELNYSFQINDGVEEKRKFSRKTEVAIAKLLLCKIPVEPFPIH